MELMEHIEHWIFQADNDIIVAESLYKNGHYAWCLFICHLVLEKALKALFIKTTGNILPPKIHNLVRLAEHSGINLDNNLKQFFYDVNDFNLEARYADYLSNFHNIADEKFTNDYLLLIKEKF